MNRRHNRGVWPFPKRKASPAAVLLTGAPPRPRLKTYSAESGYVYQYVYRGQRRDGNSAEFVFSVTADRKKWVRISILLEDAVVDAWAAASSRQLMEAEKYAVVKLTLFEFFDRTPGLPSPGTQPLRPRADEIQRHLTALGRL